MAIARCIKAANGRKLVYGLAWGDDASNVKKYLNYYWRWDNKKQMWMRSPQSERDYLIPRLEKILHS
ncbi:hypothetical protein IQ255_13485 [Pleurocapsales cyanobacterium LEGE 10410]|nr:hypothetical protein [Pleurocapsales cyanobacterium LEGE 10410]